MLGIAGLAPLASHSLPTAAKSNQKRPPQQLRPCKKHRGSHLASTVIMLRQNSPTLKNTYAQTCWRRKLMITALAKWLAEVEEDQNQKPTFKRKKWLKNNLSDTLCGLSSVVSILIIMFMKIPEQHTVPKRKLSVFRFLMSF